MSSSACPQCLVELSPQAHACPRCGHPFGPQPIRIEGALQAGLLLGCGIAAWLTAAAILVAIGLVVFSPGA